MKKLILALTALAVGFTTSAQSSKKTTKSNQSQYGANIIRLYPLSAFAYGGVGLGAGYERILGNEGKVGINIPIHFGMQNDYDNWNGSSSDVNYSFMVNPGVKFYPMGQRKVTYGLGASLFFMQGGINSYSYLPNGSARYYNGTHTRAGVLVDNSVQFNIAQKLNLGLSLGLGPSYLNRIDEGYQVTNEGIRFMANFGFHIGYRF